MKTVYQAKTMRGAEREVRRLRTRLAEVTKLMNEYHQHRMILAKVAADGPAFYNPLEAIEAQTLRDNILRQWCRLNPDGTPLR